MTVAGSDADLAWLAGELSAIRRELLPAGESRALCLALDQGGTSSRAVLFDALGREVAAAHVPIDTQRPAPDRVEHDAAGLLQSLRTAIRDACESPLVAGRPIVAAGLATQRSTVCCWDAADGTPLSPALSWQDRRHAHGLQGHLGSRAAWVRELTGLPLSPHYGASKLRWCLDELPAVQLALRDGRLRIGPLASYLLQGLCEERPALVDPANASRTLLYDVAMHDWSPPLLDAFGIPRAALPGCVGTRHEFGTLRLPSGQQVPLRACSGDQSASLFAFGAPAGDTAYVNAGTGAFVQRVLQDGTAAPQGLLQSVVYAGSGSNDRALHSHEGTVNGAHAALDWLGRRIGIDIRRCLTSLSGALADGRMPLLFLNGIGGLAAPYWRPDFESGFVAVDGVSAGPDGATELQQVGAVVESIAFLVAVNIEAMQRVAPLQRVVITGGLGACDYLCEVLADVTGLPVERPALLEATSRGIAWLAAGDSLDWQPVPVDRRYTPRPGSAPGERFLPWRAALERRLSP